MGAMDNEGVIAIINLVAYFLNGFMHADFLMSEYGHRADWKVYNKSILQINKLQIWLLQSFIKSPFHFGPWFNINMSSYQYIKSHCGDKTIWRPSYLHNGISYTGKMISLYWITDLVKLHSIYWWLSAKLWELYAKVNFSGVLAKIGLGSLVL